MSSVERKVVIQIAIILGLFQFYYNEESIEATLEKLLFEYSQNPNPKFYVDVENIISTVESFGREKGLNPSMNFLIVLLDNLTQEQLKFTRNPKRVELWNKCLEYITTKSDYNKTDIETCSNGDELTEYINNLIKSI